LVCLGGSITTLGIVSRVPDDGVVLLSQSNIFDGLMWAGFYGRKIESTQVSLFNVPIAE